MPRRSRVSAGHPYQGAPYGLYPTADGHLALAMGGLDKLADTLGLDRLRAYADRADVFGRADEIRGVIADHVATQTTDHWLGLLEPADVWCAKVLRYDELREQPGYRVLDIEQTVARDDAPPVRTLRSPIRINGERLFCSDAAPRVGRDNDRVRSEMLDA